MKNFGKSLNISSVISIMSIQHWISLWIWFESTRTSHMGKHYWVFECWQIANQSALPSSYLKSAVELTDIMLKLLEQYSSKNQFMFVRRKIKQKKTQGKVKKTRLLGWYLYCFKRYDNGSRSGWRRVWRWRTWNPSGISWARFQVWCFWKGKQHSLYPSLYTFSNASL